MKAIVLGNINVDITALGFTDLEDPAEAIYGNKLLIGPGGKSANIARMLATLLGLGQVAIITRSTKDPQGFCDINLKALEDAGVDTSHLKLVPYDRVNAPVGAALIVVDQEGKNRIYVVEGVNKTFCPQDLDERVRAFDLLAQNNGILIMTMEQPFPTALHALEMAGSREIEVFLDPGGHRPGVDIAQLLKKGVYLFKPNIEEAEFTLGCKINGLEDASKAAQKLSEMGAENVLLTMGETGAILMEKDFLTPIHIQTSFTDLNNSAKDATGCGDQTMAALAASHIKGYEIKAASRLAVKAGSMQFLQEGAVPISAQAIFGDGKIT